MSKELDLVNGLIEGIDDYEKQTGRKNPPAYISREVLVEIQQALQRLEAIENTKPSESLEWQIKQALDELYDVAGNIKNLNAEYNTIKQYILKAQENEKENQKLKSNLARWLALLETDGIDSKNMVATDIQQLLEEIDK